MHFDCIALSAAPFPSLSGSLPAPGRLWEQDQAAARAMLFLLRLLPPLLPVMSLDDFAERVAPLLLL